VPALQQQEGVAIPRPLLLVVPYFLFLVESHPVAIFSGMDVLELLGGSRCAGCQMPGRILCPSCSTGLRSPLAPIRVPGVDRAAAAWAYEGTARSLILGLKLRGRRAYAGPLVAGLVAVVRAEGVNGSLITWVPGRPRDTRRRGFDHAAVLARGLSASLGLPVRPLLQRTAGVRPDQTRLSRAERLANLDGAFVARACKGPMILVDDLVTTGATAAACASALRIAGASGVELVVACRA
jgi:predicted amidophosphoribosyltransferase